MELVQLAQNEQWFPSAEKKDFTGWMGHPLELVLLGAHQYLGRGFTFNNLEEATFISKSSHHNFFHELIEIGSTVLIDEWIGMPKTHKELMDCMYEFNQAGFPGCIGSSDATHVVHEKCHSRLKNHHLGAKSTMATKAFNIVVNHRRKILNTTVGLLGHWNDKTVVFIDGMLSRMQSGTLYNDFQFSLEDGNGNEVLFQVSKYLFLEICLLCNKLIVFYLILL
jgi:hypothetical protein